MKTGSLEGRGRFTTNLTNTETIEATGGTLVLAGRCDQQRWRHDRGGRGNKGPVHRRPTANAGMVALAAILGAWEGYTLGTVGRFEAGQGGRTRAEVRLEVLPLRGHPRVCSGCGKPCRSVHDTAEPWVDDLPTFTRTRPPVTKLRS